MFLDDNINCGDLQMKIAFVGRNILKPHGGAELSALLLLRELLKSHKVLLFEIVSKTCVADQHSEWSNRHEWIQSKIFQWRIAPYELRCLACELLLNKELEKWCNDIKPDMVLMQHFFSTAVGRKGIPTIVFIRDDSGINISAPLLSKLYNMPFAALRRRQIRRADLVVANSKFTAEVLQNFRIQSEVIYPFIETENYKIHGKFNPKYITFIRPEPWKGLEIALSIAKRMPGEKFLFVGNSNPKLAARISDYKNVSLSGWSSDMRQIYRKTKIVIMPSIWDEPFGRVPIEAGINGIPTIASNRGGLPESVGKGGILIDNPYDINAWLSAIQKIESNRSTFSNKAIYHAKNFTFKKNFDNFKKIVRKNLNLNI